MSRIEELQREIQDATAAVARAERAVAAHPDIPSATATLRSIIKRRDYLEAQFLEAADELGLDVCSYRIELENDARPTIAGLTAVLGEFQKVFTSVYHALKNGPKLTAKVSADTTNATALNFGYTFPGSIGVMMTLENERMLAITPTELDEAMAKTMELLSASRSQELEGMAEVVGLPALRHAHHWAEANAQAGFGADIVWQREQTVKQHVRVQQQEIVRLEQAIRRVTAKEDQTVIGDLIHVNLNDKTFEMSVEDKPIRGTFTNAIGPAHPAQLPKRYRATLRVTERIVADEAQEERAYFLIKLEDVDPSTDLAAGFTST